MTLVAKEAAGLECIYREPQVVHRVKVCCQILLNLLLEYAC